mmetsp:Transcript_33689/g.87096  ORF Transcript_33689/g.87096 Transcript_33689/m.87096 type:complete len:204 (+) Transcript_33689:2922-3533(+)
MCGRFACSTSYPCRPSDSGCRAAGRWRPVHADASPWSASASPAVPPRRARPASGAGTSPGARPGRLGRGRTPGAKAAVTPPSRAVRRGHLQFLLLFLLLALDLNRDILDVLDNAPSLRNKDVVVVRLEQVLDRLDKLLLQREFLLYVRDLPRQIRLVALLTIGWLSVDQLRLHSRQFRRIELLLRGGREPELLLLIGIRRLPR